jgi:MFS family permease
MEGLMAGLYLLWWVQEKQMSPAVVAGVLAAGDLAVMALELPTGWIADRFGHRVSLIIGSGVQVAGMTLCWLGDGLAGLLAASLLVAVGDAFRSGACQALLYRSCVALGREERFQVIEARTGAVELCALVALIAAGGAIVTTAGFAAGWIAEIALCVAGLGIACAMFEPPAAGDENHDHHAAGGWQGLFSARMVVLMVPAALLGGAAGAVSFIAQTSAASTPLRATILVAVVALAEAAGSLLATRLREGGVRQQIGLATAGALVCAGALTMPPVFLPAVTVLSLLAGVAGPLRDAAIQRLAADDGRARAASMASACDMLCSTLMLPLAGAWRARR